ncbi:hypothetical protein [Streptomyces sp. F001]|uniref:hypothetical protein n=1 Tax=Streptomyces sp. F001 TaxID=1510026 RepID=UPI0019D02D85|nr:hypothetical protein [Streptomyces sp. F001]
MLEGPQRLRLHLGPAIAPARDRLHGLTYVTEDWTAARRFWDVRRTGELRHSAGPADSGRLPFLHPDGTPLAAGELPAEDPGPADPAARAEWVAVLQARGAHIEAYAAAGLDLDLTPPPQGPRSYRQLDVAQLITYFAPDLTRIAPEVRLLERAGRGTCFRIPVDWRGCLRVTLAAADGAPAQVVGRDRGQEEDVPACPRTPGSDCPTSACCAPAGSGPRTCTAGRRRAVPAGRTRCRPARPDDAAPVRVRCGGVWHEVVSRNGVLDIPHRAGAAARTRPARLRRHRVRLLRHPARLDQRRGRLPRALRDQRRELFQHASTGHPRRAGAARRRNGPARPRPQRRGLLHVLHLLDHRELLRDCLPPGSTWRRRTRRTAPRSRAPSTTAGPPPWSGPSRRRRQIDVTTRWSSPSPR